MLVETAAEYFFLAACVLVALGLLGLPMKLLLRLVAGERLDIPTPLLGIALAVIGGWYAYGLGSGLRSVFQLGCVLGMLVAAACLVVRRRTLRADARDVARRLMQPAFVAGGTALVLVFSAGSMFSIQYPTVLTAGNMDAAAYAMFGQHVADEAPDDAGPVVGQDLGARSTQSFDFGPIAVVAAASAVGPFAEVWRYLMPLMGVVIGLVAYSVALCLDRVFPGRLLLTGVAAIASICPFLFQYLWSQFFLNQIVSIGVILVICLVVTRGATRTSVRSRVAHALGAGALVAVLVASYPHVIVFGPILLVPPLFLAQGVRDLGRRLFALVVQGVASLLVAFCLLPTLATRAPETLRLLSSANAGWPLSGFLPAEVLGALVTADPVHEQAREWVPSVVVLALLAAACIVAVLTKTAVRLGWFTLLLYGLCLGSYGLVFALEGPSYRQWKWITQYTPILVGAGVLVGMVTIAYALRRHGARAQELAVAAGVAYCALAVASSLPTTFPFGRSLPGNNVSLDLITLEDNPAFVGIDEMNVDVPPYWETMWAAYFLRDRQLHLVKPSYYAISLPTAAWTLERVDTPGATPPLEVRPINATYQLVRR